MIYIELPNNLGATFLVNASFHSFIKQLLRTQGLPCFLLFVRIWQVIKFSVCFLISSSNHFLISLDSAQPVC